MAQTGARKKGGTTAQTHGAGAGVRRDRLASPTKKVNLTFDTDLMQRVEAHAKRLGISKAALLSIAASMFMDNLLDRRRE
ncbi:hypothetical protein [Paraburkholderia adhaesiva]|uniref:hypothetical protein n=1 Tax=Paraburkholderia adhaesiva TaxID=2883244 RepID=UPI001F3F4313|nr:hypothetical protein [Paraburkholderia adhaesiva]